MLTILGFAISTSVDLILAAIALIILLGYIGEAIFRFTRIPEILILMFLGILIGQFVPSGYTTALRALTPLLSSIALIMIMFNSGRVMRFEKGKSIGGRGFLLAFLDVVLTGIALAVVMHYAFGWPFLYGAILGIILGESSTIIIIPIIKKFRSGGNIYNTMLMETTFNTTFAILAFYLLIPANMSSFSTYSYVQYLIDYLSVPVFLGIVTGIIWIALRSAIRNANSYLASLAIAILLYGFVDFLHGAAVIAVLIYAIILGNERFFAKVMGVRIMSNRKLKIVEEELEFLLRTFFFVLIGMIAILSVNYLVVAVVATAVLLIVRYPEVKLVMFGYEKPYQNLTASLMQKGLGVAVLSSIVYTMAIPYSEQIFAVSFMVIVISNVISAPMLRWFTKDMALTKSEQA